MCIQSFVRRPFNCILSSIYVSQPPQNVQNQWKSHRAQCLRGISLLNSTLILFVTLLSIVKFILFSSVSFLPSKHSRSLISFVSHSITPSAKALKLVVYTDIHPYRSSCFVIFFSLLYSLIKSLFVCVYFACLMLR